MAKEPNTLSGLGFRDNASANPGSNCNTVLYKLRKIISYYKNIIGEKGKLLTENLEVTISFYNESPISIDLPNQVSCKIETTDAALKGQTASSSYKPATLENGLNIQVPPFIESGDIIVIDTRNLEYIKKI